VRSYPSLKCYKAATVYTMQIACLSKKGEPSHLVRSRARSPSSPGIFQANCPSATIAPFLAPSGRASQRACGTGHRGKALSTGRERLTTDDAQAVEQAFEARLAVVAPHAATAPVAPDRTERKQPCLICGHDLGIRITAVCHSRTVNSGLAPEGRTLRLGHRRKCTGVEADWWRPIELTSRLIARTRLLATRL